MGYKIINGYSIINTDCLFLRSNRRSRVYSMKLLEPLCRPTSSKSFFAARDVNIWNQLPTRVSHSCVLITLNSLHHRLSRFIRKS